MRLLFSRVLDDLSVNIAGDEVATQIGEAVQAIIGLFEDTSADEQLAAFAHILPIIVDVRCENLRRDSDIVVLEKIENLVIYRREPRYPFYHFSNHISDHESKVPPISFQSIYVRSENSTTYVVRLITPASRTCNYGSTLADPSLVGGSLQKVADPDAGDIGSAWASVR